MSQKINSIVFLDAKTLGDYNLKDSFSRFGNYTEYRNSKPEEVIERAKGADVLITNKVYIGKEVIDAAKNLKLICVSATGVNNIDTEYADKKGIAVKNVKGYSTDSVAQHTFALMFSMLNHTAYFDSFVKRENGYRSSDMFSNFDFEIWELKGKTLGIIGLGAIGKRVADIASAFGANIVFYSTSGRNSSEDYQKLELDELLSKSDIVSIHAPLNENTKDLLNYDNIKLMPRHSLIINTGRGGIINEEGLAKALNDDLIAMAGLDVFVNEPIDGQNPLLSLKNPDKIVFSPHVAWASKEARNELIEGVHKNIESVFG